jgi:hypothetical protein
VINVSLQAFPMLSPWRVTASKVVEELFPVTPQGSWNALLDLRGLLISGNDWSEVLESFLSCRRRLEEDHYLPFYRLRKILAAHLQLESGDVSLASLLRKRDFSFRRWQEQARQGGDAVRLLKEVSPLAGGIS